ncbi:UNVERIFIED_CONTAM: hypothetical protein GTU68_003233 [Idotea baltica]|nr:hypothetical protein [Idotea baltica]
MNKSISLSSTLLLCAALSACGTNPSRNAGATDVDAGPKVTPVSIDGPIDTSDVDPNSIAGRAPKERVIFFDYNQSELRPEYLDIVTQHGRYLAQNPTGRARLEGHTDERGTREYNIALGEARAKTIARMLQLQGVSSAQLRSVSYGEELPVDEAHNEAAWSKNRRVNIIYEVEIQN